LDFYLGALVLANLWILTLVHLMLVPICGLWPWGTCFGQFMDFDLGALGFRAFMGFSLNALIWPI